MFLIKAIYMLGREFLTGFFRNRQEQHKSNIIDLSFEDQIRKRVLSMSMCARNNLAFDGNGNPIDSSHDSLEEEIRKLLDFSTQRRKNTPTQATVRTEYVPPTSGEILGFPRMYPRSLWPEAETPEEHTDK